MPGNIKEPWLSFLRDIDRALTRGVEVHCLGGFVLGVLWGLPRPTGDIDFIEIRPGEMSEELLKLAGQGSELAARYRLHFQRVPIAAYPDGYGERLIDITPEGFRNLTLRAFEVHDIILSKVSRNSPRDRFDVEFLAKKGLLDRQILKKRFTEEVVPYVLNEARETLTLELWLDEFLTR